MKKIVLITGASSGIGRETAIYLAQNGYKVYGVARRKDKLKELETKNVITLQMDVTNEESVTEGLKYVIEKEGKIDILINSAGYGEYGAIEDVSIANAKNQMEVNVFGLARITQAIIPFMRKQKFGKIVNISSTGGKMAAPLGGWYHASKFALEGLSDSLRMELKPFGIDVIVIEPGGVKSEWGQIAFDKAKEASGNSLYASLIVAADRVARQAEKHSPEPIEIARVIKRAIEAKNPKTRYVKGYLARPIMFLKMWASDRMFDKIVMSQMK